MIVWSLALATVLLLAAWGAANWKVFHLAYCRHLLQDTDYRQRQQGLRKLLLTHVRAGMSPAELKSVFRSPGLDDAGRIWKFQDSEGDVDWDVSFCFEDDRLSQLRLESSHLTREATAQGMKAGREYTNYNASVYSWPVDKDGRFPISDSWPPPSAMPRRTSNQNP